MPKSVEDHIAEMLAEIQAGRDDPLEARGNGHTPAPLLPATAAPNEEGEKEPVHVFFVRESEVKQALLDAQSVEAEPEAPAQPQPVTPTPPSRKRNAHRDSIVLSVGMFTICVLISILLVLLFIVPQFLTPTVTVTIIPREQHISTTATMQLHGRLLPTLTLSQSVSVPATGKRHQDATEAQGSITFYNGQFASVIIPAGIMITSATGIHIIINKPAVIPAANPPIFGQTTVSAHAAIAGSQGNIPAYDINTACCLTSVLAKNTEAFTGGQNARDYLVVTKADIDQAAATIQTSLEKSERAALQAQVNPGEGLVTPPCSKLVNSDHQPGDEAREVTVSVSETCSSVAYDAQKVYANATQLIHKEAIKRLGTGYSLLGDMQFTILHAITDHTKGIATLSVKIAATYVYQMSPGEKQHLLQLIAGKKKQEALKALLHLPGIQAASVTSNAETLPENPGRITIVVVYRSA